MAHKQLKQLTATPDEKRFELLQSLSPDEQINLLGNPKTYTLIPMAYHMQLIELASFKRALSNGCFLTNGEHYYAYPLFLLSLSPRAMHSVTSAEYQSGITLEKNELPRCFNFNEAIGQTNRSCNFKISHMLTFADTGFPTGSTNAIRQLLFALLIKSAEFREEHQEQATRRPYTMTDPLRSSLSRDLLQRLRLINNHDGTSCRRDGNTNHLFRAASTATPDQHIADVTADAVRNDFEHWLTAPPPFKNEIIVELRAIPNTARTELLNFLTQQHAEYHSRKIKEPSTLKKLKHWIAATVCKMTADELLAEIEARRPEYAPIEVVESTTQHRAQAAAAETQLTKAGSFSVVLGGDGGASAPLQLGS